MATENDKNAPFQVLPAPQYPFAGQQQVFFYAPQPIPVPQGTPQVTNDEAFAKALQEQENQAAIQMQPILNEGCEKSSGCERRWGCRRWGSKWQRTGCCWKDDGRPLGNLTNFIQGLVFGTFAPIFSLMTVYGFETSKLTRTGAIFGNANFFLLLAAGLVVSVVHEHIRSCAKLWAIAPLVVGLIFLIAAKKSLRWFMWVYDARENKTESEKVKVVSESGSCCGFALAFLASFLLPILGTFVVLIAKRRYLKSRMGAFYGLGFALIITGTVLAFKGVPPVLLAIGLMLVQVSAAHFKRALSEADD